MSKNNDPKGVVEVIQAHLNAVNKAKAAKQVLLPRSSMYNALKGKNPTVKTLARRGYRVTTPLRTFSDVISAESVAIDQIEMGIREALRKGLISKGQIYTKQERYSQVMSFFKDRIDDRSI